MNRVPLLIIGAGGHGKTVAEAALSSNKFEVLGFIDIDPGLKVIHGLPVVGTDEDLSKYAGTSFIVGLGSVGDSTHRSTMYSKAIQAGLRPATVVHHSTVVASSAQIGDGSMVAPGCVVDPEVFVGVNVILNASCTICHDSVIGNHSHVSPGAVVCGSVTIGQRVHIGAGATILQGVKVNDSAIIGAGAVVIHDVEEHATVVGVPARPIYF